MLTTTLNTYARLFVEEYGAVWTEATLHGEVAGLYRWAVILNIQSQRIPSYLIYNTVYNGARLWVTTQMYICSKWQFAFVGTYLSSQVGCSGGPHGL